MVDYVDVICLATGHTRVHNRAITDAVAQKLKTYGIIPDSLQGYRDGGWVLLDFGVLVVHVLIPELRKFYRLEELWTEGREIHL